MKIEVRLRQLMEQRGLSVPKLAAQTGISPHNIYGLLGAPNRVHLPTLAKLCEALQVTPCEVLVPTSDQERGRD